MPKTAVRGSKEVLKLRLLKQRAGKPKFAGVLPILPREPLTGEAEAAIHKSLGSLHEMDLGVTQLESKSA